jgi:hypothetical protein
LFYGLTVTSSVADLDPHQIEKIKELKGRNRIRNKVKSQELWRLTIEPWMAILEPWRLTVEPRSVFRPAVEEGGGSGSE